MFMKFGLRMRVRFLMGKFLFGDFWILWVYMD